MADPTTHDWFDVPDMPPGDPVKLAQRAMAAPLPGRFYRYATFEERDGAFVLLLDGRAARTPARHRLALPTRAVAEAVAAEWAAQSGHIDPRTMPVTRLAMSAIDAVAPNRQAVADDICKYAGSDLVCYRAGEPAKLVARQSAIWDPVLAWAHETFGARFLLSQGIVFVAQPETSMAAIRSVVDRIVNPFALAALHVLTTLTGSALLALAVAHGRLNADAAWTAAHVDEDFQIEAWGADAEAAVRRRGRRADFDAAVSVVGLAGAPEGRVRA